MNESDNFITKAWAQEHEAELREASKSKEPTVMVAGKQFVPKYLYYLIQYFEQIGWLKKQN